MKKLRYLYLGITIIFTVGFSTPSTVAFAEMMNSSEPTASIDAGETTDKISDVETSEDDEVNIEESDENSEAILPVSEGENGTILPNVVVYSYNPGFSDPYVGEFVELRKLQPNSILLAGLSIIYETSSGSEYGVFEFDETYEMVGESLLLRLASSDEVKNAEDESLVADLTYTRNMAQSAGRIKLRYNEEEIDSLCWGLKEVGCYDAFKTGKKKPPTTLVREVNEEEIGDFVFSVDYVPVFDPLKLGILVREVPEEIVEPQCRSLEFTELYTYYETSATEQFVELYNSSDEEMNLDGCLVNYKGKNHNLGGKLGARKFLAIYPFAEWGLTLTKNPTSSNKLSLIDVDGETVDNLVYYSGQKKGVSLAKQSLGKNGGWAQTYSLTAGAENVYQKFKTCPVGKVINLETGNCVNEVAPVVTLAACPAGKYRNPLTGRCKSYATTESTELKPCAEGYERNSETNRCRKIETNTGADDPVETGNCEEKRELTSVFAIATVVVAGLGYIAFQYKDELRMKLKPVRR
ncbi:lamin tail domain-containing protein [Candidatus Saccharibacteria bacterium]|nr:lamin tail domain-containing protein [Candidatus Saccharibacteria bacterium]